MLASVVDTTPAQFTADALLLGLVGLNVYLGWRFGLLRRIVGFAGLYLGCLAATNVGNAVAAAVHPGSVEVNAWCFIAVLAVVVGASEVLGALFNERLQRIAVVLFDRIAGIVSGTIVGLAEALVVFLVAYAVAAAPTGSATATRDHAAPADAIQSAALAGQAVRISPEVRVVFGAVLPENLAKHLSDGTRFAGPPF